MRVVAVSDLHGILPTPPPADLVLLAGDMCPVEDHRLHFQASWLDTEFRWWLESIEAPVVAIAGNHDLVFQNWSNYQHARTGSPSLMQRILKVKPQLVVFGHIHEDHGMWEVDGVQLANVSLVDERYRPIHEPVVFRLQNSR